MKKYKKIILTLFLGTALSMGCTDDFEELNTNPEALTEVGLPQIGPIFSQAQFVGNGLGRGPYQLGQSLFGDLYAQYFSTVTPNFPSDRNVQVGRWVSGFWNTFYLDGVSHMELSLALSADGADPGAEAITKILKVGIYHKMTDYFGPIPYSQAVNGETTVPFDSQESIYANFFVLLDEAIATLNGMSGSVSSLASHDLMYGADVAQWTKYANSLKLRLAMRISGVDPAKAQAEAEEAVASGVMELNADNAEITAGKGSQNPIGWITSWNEFRMSATMESTLKGYEDPRMAQYFNPTTNNPTEYEGLRNGLSPTDISTLGGQGTLAGDYSNMNDQFLRGSFETTNFGIMYSSEVYLLRAEGALNGWNMGGTAQELYELGIRRSMEQNGVDTPSIDAYIADAVKTPIAPGDTFSSPAVADIPVAFGATEAIQREQVGLQKWLALYPNGWEAWTELRRTGYPKVYDNISTDNPDVPTTAVPQRMMLPESESDLNNAEYVKAQGLLGGPDKPLTPVWWDTNN